MARSSASIRSGMVTYPIIARGIRIVKQVQILTDLSYRPVWLDLVPLPDRV